MRGGASILALFWLTLAIFADGIAVEAIRRDGSPGSGMLNVDERGAFQFRSREKPVSLVGIDVFHCRPGEIVPLLAFAPSQIRLAGGQVLLGEVIRGDADRIVVRTSWARAISIPRAAVEELAAPSGWQPVFADSFEVDSPSWRWVGKPERRRGDCTSGKFGLALDISGQSAAMALPEEIPSGQVRFHVRTPNRIEGRRWHLEMKFAGPKESTATIRIDLAGTGEFFEVHSPVKAEYLGRIRRTSKWRQLIAEFTPKTLSIFVDDVVLWSQAAGPGGKLRECRLMCEVEGEMARGEGAAIFDDFAIQIPWERKMAATTVDASQDAVTSWDGDSLFGKVARLDPFGISLDGKFAKRESGWPEIASLQFRRGAFAVQSINGEQVRVSIRTNENRRDLLDGVVKSLDAEKLVLRHAILGDLTIPGGRIDQIRPRFHGEEIVIDNEAHHLGKKIRPGFLIPKPEGLSLTRRFRLERLGGDATLVVEAGHICGSSDGKDIAAALQRGGLQSAVFVNDRRVGCLNDLVDRSSPNPKSLRSVVPKNLLAIGENVLEIRQTVDAETGQAADAEIRSIRLEVRHDR